MPKKKQVFLVENSKQIEAENKLKIKGIFPGKLKVIGKDYD